MLGPLFIQGFLVFYLALAVYVWASLWKEFFPKFKEERRPPVKSVSQSWLKDTWRENLSAWPLRILNEIRCLKWTLTWPRGKHSGC